MRARPFFLAATLVATFATGLSAQDGRFTVGARVFGAVPVDETLSESVGFGVGAGVEGRFRVTGGLHVYAGYSGSRFGFSSLEGVQFEDGELHITDQGFDVGVLASFTPAATPSVRPHLRAGVLAHYLKYGGDAIDRLNLSGEADEGVGFELGFGVDVRLSRRLDLTPSATYRHLPYTDITGEDATYSLLTAGLTLNYRL